MKDKFKDKTLLFTVLTLSLLAMAGYYLWKQDKPSVSQQKSEENATSISTDLAEKSSNIQTPVTQQTDSHTDIPSQDDIRAQIEEDPHHTPPAMLEYAESIGGKMESAMESPQAAEELFSELTHCVLDSAGKTSVSIQALCLSDAEELKDMYPQNFNEKYSDLSEKASDEVKKLLGAVKDLE